MDIYDVYLGLCCCVSLGCRKASELLETAPDKNGLFDGDLKGMEKAGIITGLMRSEMEKWSSEAFRNGIKQEMERKGIRFVPQFEKGFPLLLKETELCPLGLFVSGSLPGDDELCIAVIGSRGCSGYGRSNAFSISKELAEGGISIVSGMAAGIDSAAIRGALEGGGRAYAVLGSGLAMPKAISDS